MVATFMIIVILSTKLGVSMCIESKLKEPRTLGYVASILVYIVTLVLLYYAGLFDKFIIQ